MAKYIKASLRAAQLMKKDRCGRQRTSDGCVLLWQNDMLPLGPLTDLETNAARIGALVLTAEEAREEARGITHRPLPEPTDPAYRETDTQSEISEQSDQLDQLVQLDQFDQSEPQNPDSANENL